MTALYATPRAAMFGNTRVMIHGYGQVQFDNLLDCVAIVELPNGQMSTAPLDKIVLCAPTAPQLGGGENEQQRAVRNKAILPACSKCKKRRELEYIDEKDNPVCLDCWAESLPF